MVKPSPLIVVVCLSVFIGLAEISLIKLSTTNTFWFCSSFSSVPLKTSTLVNSVEAALALRANAQDSATKERFFLEIVIITPMFLDSWGPFPITSLFKQRRYEGVYFSDHQKQLIR